jgi:pyrroloquinoline quinone biosynthesis protein B
VRWKALAILLVGFSIVAVWTSRAVAPGPTVEDAWELVVLGVAQDAGIPHLACEQELCVSIREGKRKRERVASIGLVNPVLGRAYLFDATPDLPTQLHDLNNGRPPDGIFLTHAHIGHYTGLMYLGRESVDFQRVPVYGTERMTRFLRDNGPWSLLTSRRNVDLRTVVPDQRIDLEGGAWVTPILVPHRDEFTDTVGYLISGPNRRALFIPDIDQWQKWERDIRVMADEVDYLLVDGTFASPDEIPGRSVDDIPHPMMQTTRDLLRGTKAMLRFIHVNHTNRQLEAQDVARDGARFPM